MGYSYGFSFWFGKTEQFYMFYITAKSNGICFIGPIKQPELTNFLFTFWLKNTFHFPLSWLLMVPIVVNSDRKKKPENFLCPKVVLFSASLGVNRQGNERSYALSQPEQNLINQTTGFHSLVPSSTRVETKERIPKQAILLNYCVRLGNK